MTVFENIRCGLLWSQGYRYSFWHLLGRQKALNEAADQLLERLKLSDRRNLPAGLLSYAEQRALEIGITIAGGAEIILLDEPTAGMSHSETDSAVALIRSGLGRQDADHGRARHERGVRPCRPHHRAGLRRGDRLRRADRHPRQRRRAGSLSRDGGGMMLEVRDLHAFYGKSHILQGVDLTVDQGEIVSLLGRNGVGRSTACKTIMGLVPPVGADRLQGPRRSPACGPTRSPMLGIGYVPEDRQVFPGLTVRQNLELGLKRAGVVRALEIRRRVLRCFPTLPRARTIRPACCRAASSRCSPCAAP